MGNITMLQVPSIANRGLNLANDAADIVRGCGVGVLVEVTADLHCSCYFAASLQYC
jgi:hypothetical protein